MSDTETVTYVGTVAGLEEGKNGWYKVKIAVPGKQYPVHADTKLEPILKDVRTVRDSGQVATFTVTESDSQNINPNNNKPYRERRLEKVEIGAQAGAGTGQGGGASVEAHHDPIADSDRQRLITRQTCLKVAAQVYQGQGLSAGASDWDVPKDVMKAAQRFERWLYRDIDEVPSTSGTDAAPARSQEDVEAEVEALKEAHGEGSIPDDDIPF